ncbi:MAG: NlpC/P60 family protein [Gemmatimonadaceae bacterium]
MRRLFPIARCARAARPTTVALFALVASACGKSAEKKLATEFETWKGTPYADHGTTHAGISNAAFVREMFHNSFAMDIPGTADEQYHTGKLVVDKKDLKPGDLVFFETGSFIFKTRNVAIYMGNDEVAIARRETHGVALVKLDSAPYKATYKTARHINTDPKAGPPVFDAAKYGNNRAGLLRDMAVAWTGTLYLDQGTTFDGIGNYEYVKSVYEGLYDAELEGTPAQWSTMGEAIKKDALEPGDIILYQAVGIGGAFGRQHAGIYIGDGEFTHCVKGQAVTISKLDDPRWAQAFRAARRVDPDMQAKLRVAKGAKPIDQKILLPTTEKGNVKKPNLPSTPPPVVDVSNRAFTDTEKKLRVSTAAWRGTPYKIGGTTKAGVDCSAFVRAAYKEALAVDLPRTSAEQELLGKDVLRTELQSGDLVFFRTQGMGPFFKSRHVGVYLGGGEFAQSSGSHGVTISRLDDYYWNKKYHGARRLIASE